MTNTLQCCMTNCRNTVTHIGAKGWVYCAADAADRQYWERCRKMKQWEIRRLERGSFISYQPITQAAFDAKYPEVTA